MRVKSNFKGIMNLADLVILKPGMNLNVDREKFRQAFEIKLVRDYVEAGDLVPFDDETRPQDLPEPQAIKLAGSTIQTDVLLDWLNAEKRQSVRSAIEARLDQLAPPMPGSKGDEPDDEESAKGKGKKASK